MFYDNYNDKICFLQHNDAIITELLIEDVDDGVNCHIHGYPFVYNSITNNESVFFYNVASLGSFVVLHFHR